jgi:pimeloyl-ACP methyl ester carboxylesterase
MWFSSITNDRPLPRFVARAFGEGLLAYLRPQIQSICVNLYPTNPDAVDSELCENIRRDSLDPGAINVMIAGSKLPTPRTYNEVIAADFGRTKDTSLLESIFTGPVLVAQGILDPLNDAKGRAAMLGTLRKGVKSVPLQGGHCPHDEIPEEVAGAIAEWMRETTEERKEMLKSAGKVVAMAQASS